MKQISIIKIKTILLPILLSLVAAVGFATIITVFAWLMRPDMSQAPEARSSEAIAAAEKSRSIDIDPANPIVLYREVDYSKGKKAAWWPKGQSPVMDKLVAEGKLPPVAERVGSEPAVVEGVDGIGRYGGSWIRMANDDFDAFNIMCHRMSASTLVRWSPHGYPIVPHIAKSFKASDDSKTFTFELRKGMKWSDGHPFTADDIMYWWEHEQNDEMVMSEVDGYMKIGDQAGDVEKLGKYRIRITFPKPNGLFLYRLASSFSLTAAPAHYRRQYHPRIGDEDKIAEMMKAYNLPSKTALYWKIRSDEDVPQHPRLWPWVYRTYKSNAPYSFVRNPYFWMVDTQGNQLPYVDQLHVEVKSPSMIGVAASSGGITMQTRHLRYDQYTLLMNGREEYGYDVYHWYPGERSTFLMSPNNNRRVDPDDPVGAQRAELLKNKKFRQALSLAINRKDIIKAEFGGQTEPAQCAPGPASYFYHEDHYKAFTRFDPEEASRLLDELGLTKRDMEGCRTYKDGSRMTFYINMSGFTSAGPAQFVADDWLDVGIRAVPSIRSRQLFMTEKNALKHDFGVWIGSGEFFPITEPGIVPLNEGSAFATGYGRWYKRGGLRSDPRSRDASCIEPPVGHPARIAMELYGHVYAAGGKAEQKEAFSKLQEIAAENLWTISICTPPPALVVVKNGFRNVPRTAVATWNFLTPGNAGFETYYFEESGDSPGTVDMIRNSIAAVTPPPRVAAQEAAAVVGSSNAGFVGALIRWTFFGIALLLVVLASVKHPYIGRRVLLMIPTLVIISVIVFTIIQLPPGDFLATRMMGLEESGDMVKMEQLEEIKELFHLEDPVIVRYARWMGLYWFASFDEKDSGLLQGNLGRSMGNNRPVNVIVGDRILLTVFISLGTILFTWAVAIPIGIFSAVKKYSLWDYILTFVGFIGICVPQFLLALLLMYAGKKYFGMDLSSLFSDDFAVQAEWDWPKFLDLLKHVWVPIFILGVGGTAGMIRVMRGNLLDELKKPYVTTARAKGVRPMKLLFKYPVRMALNPFVSGIGHLFPQLVSGGAIVAMVLSLQTVGPLMLYALMCEDMYMAGSLLMVLSCLGVFGTLVSDLLLLWLDPRIRFEGGGK